MQYTNAAKIAIENGEPERAIALLREYLEKIQNEQLKKFSEDLILLGSRYNLLKTDKIRETITYDIAHQELNKINHALIEVITEIEDISEGKGLFKNTLLMNMPRNAISDSVYYGFLLVGIIGGAIFLGAFFYTFYSCILEKDSSLPRLLVIGSLGFLSTAFLFGAYEGINRREGLLVNWKVVAPPITAAIVMILAAALMTWLVK
jgi:Effector-associated domain 11